MARRILIVDDDTEILGTLSDALSSAGFDVDTALGAEPALELVHEVAFDAAILDFDLPEMNGVMLHNRIRQVDAELGARTLFISGYDLENDDQGSRLAATGEFLAKPFDLDLVIERIETLTGNGS